MAIRGKVKDIKSEPGTMRSNGTVTDTATKTDYPFTQACCTELGIQVNSIVQFETVAVGTTSYGVSLDPVEKGTIKNVNYDLGTGDLTDGLGNIVNFDQVYAKELGIVTGSIVKYLVVNYNGKPIATSLKLFN